jgi:hypothetical protein
MGMSAADAAPPAMKANIAVAATTQAAGFNPHLAAMFEERLESSQESSMASLTGSELEMRTALAPRIRIKS